MKVLGIDSSGLVASVALISDGVLQGEYTTNYKKTHSQTLLPMLDELKAMLDLDLSSVDCIAVSCGPGSFTGLRIGSATAKGLAQALNIPIAEVPTLDGLAANMWGTEKLICPMMDARRQQVYTGLYNFEADDINGMHLVKLMDNQAISIETQIADLNERNQDVILLGDAIPVYRNILEEKLTCPYKFAPANRNGQSAGSVALLGIQLFEAGKVVNAAEHAPFYLRQSQAEQEGPKHFDLRD